MESTDSKQDAQGHPRPGKQEYSPRKSTGCELQEMKLTAATKKIETGINETLTYMDYPAQHWNKIRTNNLIERVNHELKRRTLSFERAP